MWLVASEWWGHVTPSLADFLSTFHVFQLNQRQSARRVESSTLLGGAVSSLLSPRSIDTLELTCLLRLGRTPRAKQKKKTWPRKGIAWNTTNGTMEIIKGKKNPPWQIAEASTELWSRHKCR